MLGQMLGYFGKFTNCWHFLPYTVSYNYRKAFFR